MTAPAPQSALDELARSRFDVAIVGYGPVGQALAALLGRAGHRVCAIERHDDIYPLPRAVHFDHEIMRLLQSLGLAERLAGELHPIREYHWFGADGEPIITMRPDVPAASGWEPDYMFFQPQLERALDSAARAQPTVSVHRGLAAEALAQESDGTSLTVRRAGSGETATVHAGFVIGADGANSTVREAAGIDRRDLGFREQWLVVDVLPREMRALAHLPDACQWCDPARPHMHARNGVRHRRWEFMLLPGETASDFAHEDAVWELLRPFIDRSEGEITRHAVYEFRAMLAERMRSGRVLLAGDAAHLTPPFMGQGLCAGLRDALNLAWKLDLVLRGRADEALLDTVQAEREPQNRWIIDLAVEMGRVSCQLDRAAAAERDAAMRAAGALPALGLPPLAGGAVMGHGDAPAGAMAGELSVQGRVGTDGPGRLLDEVTGGGWVLISRVPDPTQGLAPRHLRLLEQLDVKIAALTELGDRDGRLTQWMLDRGTRSVLVRPDFYVYGAAATRDALGAVLDALRGDLDSEQRRTEMTDPAMARPAFHHLNLKTPRLAEMIAWYGEVVGAEVVFADDNGAWLSNDGANHRIALLAFPGLRDDPERDTRAGLHHSAFEFDSFEQLNANYVRLREAGIRPELCLDHGMTFSYYYKDPDGNHVELQCDNFGDWDDSKSWMRDSDEFRANPIGQFVDPEAVARAAAGGESFADIHARAMAGELAPAQAPVEIPTQG
jgi:2-polyprenyl-6-methoxyphenol hydroxylase-like FAD-dependent oxidoreductase/catechol 2,3-dioxygenase-like lactoylglutathione lyase family enzyme